MFNSFFEIITHIKFPLIGLMLIFFTLSLFWVKIFKFFNLRKYDAVQRLHVSEISRLGGLAIYIFFWVVWLLDAFNDKFIFHLLVSSIPFILISLKEDLFFNTNPKLRLLSMIISCLIFFNITSINFPIIDLPYLGPLIEIKPIGSIFFIFSIVILMNGMNMIDGVNGLFSLTAIFQLLSVSFLAFSLNDFIFFNLAILLLIPLILFFLFNFPNGKIFAGDLGAYFYGFINGLLIICFFGKHQDIYAWLAVLILFYPCMEVLFSFTRKKTIAFNPLQPDNLHLHTILFNYLHNKKGFKLSRANYLSTLIISNFSLIQLFSIVYLKENLFYIIITIFILIFLYLSFYYFVRKNINN